MKRTAFALILAIALPAVTPVAAETITFLRDSSAEEQAVLEATHDADSRQPRLTMTGQRPSVEIIQQGNNHSAAISQSGNGNRFRLFQFGDGANANFNQTGNGRTAVMIQLTR